MKKIDDINSLISLVIQGPSAFYYLDSHQAKLISSQLYKSSELEDIQNKLDEIYKKQICPLVRIKEIALEFDYRLVKNDSNQNPNQNQDQNQKENPLKVDQKSINKSQTHFQVESKIIWIGNKQNREKMNQEKLALIEELISSSKSCFELSESYDDSKIQSVLAAPIITGRVEIDPNLKDIYVLNLSGPDKDFSSNIYQEVKCSQIPGISQGVTEIWWNAYMKAYKENSVVKIEYSENINEFNLSNQSFGDRENNFKKTRNIRAWVRFLKESNGKLQFIFNLIDDTELKSTENIVKWQREKLIETSRLAMLGRMSSSIAHEINNPLAVIKGHIHILEKELEKNQNQNDDKSYDNEKSKNSVLKIEKMVNRIIKIIMSLRRFSREGSKEEHHWCHLSTSIQDAIELAEVKLKHSNVVLKCNLDHFNSFEFLGESILLSQVILNLVSNSIDAIEENQEKWVEISVDKDEKKLNIRITDSGYGIDEKNRDNIMTPFYTTKEFGKGTGLGLSLAKTYMEKMKGYLDLNTNHSRTQFVISFPLEQIRSIDSLKDVA